MISAARPRGRRGAALDQSNRSRRDDGPLRPVPPDAFLTEPSDPRDSAGLSRRRWPSPSDDRHRAEEVALADLQAALGQDVVGGRRVEIEVGQREAGEIAQALEGEGLSAGGNLDLAILRAVELVWLEAADEVDCLGHARLELIERGLVVLVFR